MRKEISSVAACTPCGDAVGLILGKNEYAVDAADRLVYYKIYRLNFMRGISARQGK